MTAEIKPTQELLVKLTKAQFEHTQELLGDDHWQWSDDGWDYLNGALNLSALLLELNYGTGAKELEKFGQLLNSKDYINTPSLMNYACDGVCQAFYDLNPPALELE